MYLSSSLLGKVSLLYKSVELYWLFVDYMWALVCCFSYGFASIRFNVELFFMV